MMTRLKTVWINFAARNIKVHCGQPATWLRNVLIPTNVSLLNWSEFTCVGSTCHWIGMPGKKGEGKEWAGERLGSKQQCNDPLCSAETAAPGQAEEGSYSQDGSVSANVTCRGQWRGHHHHNLWGGEGPIRRTFSGAQSFLYCHC